MKGSDSLARLLSDLLPANQIKILGVSQRVDPTVLIPYDLVRGDTSDRQLSPAVYRVTR
jgi:hypothetical protein